MHDVLEMSADFGPAAYQLKLKQQFMAPKRNLIAAQSVDAAATRFPKISKKASSPDPEPLKTETRQPKRCSNLIEIDQQEIVQQAERNSLTTRQYAEIVGLRQKLASDGVKLRESDAIINGLCLNEHALGNLNDSTVVVDPNKRYPTAGMSLIHNPYPRPKPTKKRRRTRRATSIQSPSIY